MDVPAGELLSDSAAGPSDGALHDAVERHLLTAQLARGQTKTVEQHGWFDLVWRETWVVLRVHVDRFPTVDVFQLERGPSRGSGAYLASYDVRGLRRSGEATAEGTRTPVACARLVLELFRRGTLRAHLEALPSFRVSR